MKILHITKPKQNLQKKFQFQKSSSTAAFFRLLFLGLEDGSTIVLHVNSMEHAATIFYFRNEIGIGKNAIVISPEVVGSGLGCKMVSTVDPLFPAPTLGLDWKPMLPGLSTSVRKAFYF